MDIPTAYHTGGLPVEVTIFTWILWRIAKWADRHFTKREGINKITIRAGILGLTPEGKPTREDFSLGPFDYRDRKQKIWSQRVVRNGAPAVLWIRYNGNDEDAIVVEEGGKKIQI